MIKDIMFPLMVESLLLQESNENWSTKRKSMSVAFYKEKLIKMVDIVKQSLKDKVQ
jgi:hypothetical protein